MYLFLLVVCGMILFQNIISKEEQFCILGFIPQDTSALQSFVFVCWYSYYILEITIGGVVAVHLNWIVRIAVRP